MAVRPIFLLSISRTGSTLIQRIIGAHEGVSTAPEPWLLLPHAYTLRPRGVDAEYVHPLLVTAIEDFCDRLPDGRDDYLDELRGFALRLYEKAADDGDAYFLDKTPPYCLIAEEIMRLFPEGKFVFLWRHPLSVVASMIKTWGPWHPTFMSSDLFIGLPRLIAAYEANRDRAHAVRFEDLSGGDEARWNELMKLPRHRVRARRPRRLRESRAGGADGRSNRAQAVLGAELRASAQVERHARQPLRREWSRRYLRFLGAERLATMGYDLERINGELESQPVNFDSFAPDLWRATKDVAKEPIRVRTHGRRLGTPSIVRKLLEA